MAQDMTDERERQMNSDATEEALMVFQQDPTISSPAKMLELIRSRLNADYCYLARYNEIENVISVEPDSFVIRGGGALPRRISVGASLIADVVDRIRLLGTGIFDEEESARIRQVFKIQQIAPATPRAVLHVAVRLTVQGEFYGLLSVAYISQRHLTDIEKTYLQKNARLMESAVERKKIYLALAKAKNDAVNEGDISNSILNLMPLPCVVKDPAREYRYVRCNKAYRKSCPLCP